MPEWDEITDEKVFSFMKDAVDHAALHAREKWISGEYGLSHEERLRHAHYFDKLKTRAKELIQEMKKGVSHKD